MGEQLQHFRENSALSEDRQNIFLILQGFHIGKTNKYIVANTVFSLFTDDLSR
ncbi:MAG: hypothetical protein GX349_02420 [Firmicutes bacterium]|mgnify:CR=1 FL=1|nr:hypothetical protein [Bacillota bacterium]